ncbi:MAG: isochorismatase family protein [Acidobacteriaceae bacterium]|nr:isochorismatase family protein [Acidobacteriaceae bacterium]
MPKCSLASGHVASCGAFLHTYAVFYKAGHRALICSGLDVWLVEHGVRRLIISGIRSEQCCERTGQHASDSGYEVDYVIDAALTFTMIDRHGKQ